MYTWKSVHTRGKYTQRRILAGENEMRRRMKYGRREYTPWSVHTEESTHREGTHGESTHGEVHNEELLMTGGSERT